MDDIFALGSVAIANGKKAHSLDLHFLSLFPVVSSPRAAAKAAFSARLNSPGVFAQGRSRRRRKRRWDPMVRV